MYPPRQTNGFSGRFGMVQQRHYLCMVLWKPQTLAYVFCPVLSFHFLYFTAVPLLDVAWPQCSVKSGNTCLCFLSSWHNFGMLLFQLKGPSQFANFEISNLVSFGAILMKFGAFWRGLNPLQNAPNFIKIAPKLTELQAFQNSKNSQLRGSLKALTVLHRFSEWNEIW